MRPPRPLTTRLWIVTAENEGVIPNAFLTEREARRHMALVLNQTPSIRVDVAEYHIVGDTWEAYVASDE